MQRRAGTWLAVAILAMTSVGLVRGSATGLAGLASATGLASGTGEVLSPPVVVSDIRWTPEFEAAPPPAEYRVKDLEVDFTFTEDLFGRLSFRVTLTGGAPLPKSFDQQIDVDVSSGDVKTVIIGMDSQNVPIASVQDVHIQVCDHNSADGSSKCRKP